MNRQTVAAVMEGQRSLHARRLEFSPPDGNHTRPMHEVTPLADAGPDRLYVPSAPQSRTPAATSDSSQIEVFDQSSGPIASVPKWSRSTTGILTEPLCRSHGLHHRGLQPQQSVPRTPFSSLEAGAFVLELDQLSEEVRARLRCGHWWRC